MPDFANRFPLADSFWDEGVRRYGFHGFCYEYVLGELADGEIGRTIIDRPHAPGSPQGGAPDASEILGRSVARVGWIAQRPDSIRPVRARAEAGPDLGPYLLDERREGLLRDAPAQACEDRMREQISVRADLERGERVQGPVGHA